MALPLAINTDDTSCFGNLHRNSAINWFHYIRSLQVFSPKRDIFGCSEDAGNEQDSGERKNPTTINGKINFLEFYWFWCLWSDNFSRYTMVLAGCFLCLVPPGHNVHHYRGSNVRFHFLICTWIWDNLKSITFYYFIYWSMGNWHMTSWKVKGGEISPVWSCRWNGHLFVLYRPEKNPTRDGKSGEWNPPFF